MQMLIAVAGPYRAETEEQKRQNLDAMNNACTEVFKKGHIPVAGVNNALPVVNRLNDINVYEAIMKISLAVIDRCDAILIIAESKGVKMEKEIMKKKGLPVYYSIDEIPNA